MPKTDPRLLKTLHYARKAWQEDPTPETTAAAAQAWIAAYPDAVSKPRRQHFKRWGTGWYDLLVRYHGVCLCCGRSDQPLEADHVIPLIQGGSDSIDNIQPLCATCNSLKGATAIDFRKGFPIENEGAVQSETKERANENEEALTKIT